MNDLIKDGDAVLIYLDAKRNWIKIVKSGEEFHTNKGVISYDDIIGKPYGILIKSKANVTFGVYKPLGMDWAYQLGRATQIIYPKDAAAIIIHAGITAGSRVLESGTGSGALTQILAQIVGTTGHVYTYEIKEKNYKTAQKNLLKVIGDLNNITMKLKDVCEGIDEDNLDAIILDMATPWEVVPHAWEKLKPSGVFASYSPTIEQIMKTTKALTEERKFGMIKTIEVLEREIMVREGKTRPVTWMVAHTGYMIFARKQIKEI